MNFAITGIYASLLTILMLVLSARVSMRRAKTGISIEHGTDMVLAQTIRQHANLTEYLPMAIIVMGIAEAQGAGSMFLHIVGVILLISRVLHPFGVQHDNPKNPLRAVADVGTFASMLLAAGFILWKVVA